MGHLVVIFANSIKHGQHCIAGKLLTDLRWIRLVADEHGSELSHEEAKYTNPYGTFPVKPLQKISMNIVRHVPLVHQPENYISESGWIQAYTIEPKELEFYADSPLTLWGIEGRVNEQDIINGIVLIEQSLYLVKVDRIELFMEEKKRKARFMFNSHEYCLPVTDPNCDRIMSGQQTHNNYICVSLGECYKGFHYKIVASIL